MAGSTVTEIRPDSVLVEAELKHGDKINVRTVEEESESQSQNAFNRDEAELAYYGKRQQLKRVFGFVPIVGLTCTLMITWEGLLIIVVFGLSNGGPLGLISQFLFVWFGTLTQVAVMAEMASMIPLAGGQYNWVAILAPPRYGRFLSYVTGWVTMIAWQAMLVGGVYIVGTMIQGMAVLTHPEYEPKRWQATLMIYGALALSLFINTVLARLLPQIESWVLVVHVLGFFGVMIPVAYLGDKVSAKDVFQTFVNTGGWSSDALSWFVGINTAILSFLGVDGATHMAEEVENASRVLPRAMFASVFINGTLGFGMLITLLFAMTNVEAALDTRTGYPFMEILSSTLGSPSHALGPILVAFLVALCSIIAGLTTASRMLWAFAREKAVPGHMTVSKIHENSKLPIAAIAVTAGVSCLLSLVNIGSTAAFNAFSSLTIAGFYSAYIVAAGCGLWRRLSGHTMRYGSFKLSSKIDIPIRIFSILFSALGVFFSFWPTAARPTLQNMNWAVVVFFGTLILSLVYWFTTARRTYQGPIVETSLEEYRAKLRSN